MITRRYILILILTAFLLSGNSIVTAAISDHSRTAELWSQSTFRESCFAQPVAAKDVVYTSGSGKKYHRDRCGYLKKNKIKTTKGAARKAGYTACKVCKP